MTVLYVFLREKVRKMFFPVDCKTIGLFLKISKEIGKAWRKSLKREAREPQTPTRCVRREKKNLALALLLCEMPCIKQRIKNEWKRQDANKACAYSSKGE